MSMAVVDDVDFEIFNIRSQRDLEIAIDVIEKYKTVHDGDLALADYILKYCKRIRNNDLSEKGFDIIKNTLVDFFTNIEETFNKIFEIPARVYLYTDIIINHSSKIDIVDDVIRAYELALENTKRHVAQWIVKYAIARKQRIREIEHIIVKDRSLIEEYLHHFTQHPGRPNDIYELIDAARANHA